MTKWEDYEAEREGPTGQTSWESISGIVIMFAVIFFLTRLFL